jgi:hypothetical protein
MELTHTSLIASGPRIRAWTLTWHWEPEVGTGERIAALISFQPHPSSGTLLSPGAHVLLPKTRLSAMLGRIRADSAYGILKAAADYMTQRLAAGASIEECAPPFHGFHKGALRQALGFNTDQLIDAAVRSASAFGNADEIVEELVVEPNHSTETTRTFLARVQTFMAPANDEKRKRFNRLISLRDGLSMVVDYAHKKNLVQFVTVPLTERQQQNMLREAKAKLFEVEGISQHYLQGQGERTLVVNTSAIFEAASTSLEIANSTLIQFKQLAELSRTNFAEASNHEEAVQILSLLELEAM